MNGLKIVVSQNITFGGNGIRRVLKMGATHIPSAMAQMDGFFGCKVVKELGNDGKSAFFLLREISSIGSAT